MCAVHHGARSDGGAELLTERSQKVQQRLRDEIEPEDQSKVLFQKIIRCLDRTVPPFYCVMR